MNETNSLILPLKFSLLTCCYMHCDELCRGWEAKGCALRDAWSPVLVQLPVCFLASLFMHCDHLANVLGTLLMRDMHVLATRFWPGQVSSPWGRGKWKRQNCTSWQQSPRKKPIDWGCWSCLKITDINLESMNIILCLYQKLNFKRGWIQEKWAYVYGLMYLFKESTKQVWV